MGKTQNPRVLVVDKGLEFASTLATRLRLHGIEAKNVVSGREALAIIPLFKPDVLILDQQVADITGIKVLSRVKAIDPTIEVILLAGQGSFDAGITSMELGAFDYLKKPVDLTKLIERIKEASAQRKNNK